MEKSLNKDELKGYKTNQVRPTAMIPGIFNESPLRKNAVPQSKKSNAQSLNTSPRPPASSSTSFYQFEAKEAFTAPHNQHKRAVSNLKPN